jgi:hypothetical protein
MKVAYFPLRSSVELFKDPTSPQPVSRAKHAAILYDTVVFEIGLFEQTIGKTGAFGTYVPPQMADADRLQRARKVHEVGSSFRVAIGVQPELDVPAAPEAMRTVLETDIAAYYAAEWHTGVTDELETLKPDWAGPLDGEQLLAEQKGLKDEIQRLKSSLESAAPPSDNSFHRTFTIDAFSRDAVIAGAMEAAVQVTSLFAPLMSGMPNIAADHPGMLSLNVAVPGIEQLPWEAICEFRDHAGSEEARAKLRNAEERVAAETVSDPAAFALRVGQEITDDLFAAIAEMKGSVAKRLVKEGVNAGISLLPVVGTFSSAVSAAEAVAESSKQSRTWHAALMKLRSVAASGSAADGDDPTA